MPEALKFAGVGLFLFVLALCLQWRNGAFQSEFGGHPDEAAHFVTGLMVRDYVCQGFPGHPMRFAEDYYDHYPKVALGHYPPAFYALEGAWLSVFPVTRFSALLFMAAFAAAFGMVAFSWAREEFPLPHALVIGTLSASLPLAQTMTSTVMADLALALACLLAARSFAAFLRAPGWRPSLLFGFWAAVAALTKGSGLFLALLPPAAILIAWKPEVLRRPALWLAPLPVALLVGPWMFFTRGITAEGMIESSPLEHLRLAVPYFIAQYWKCFGPAIAALSLGGIARLFLRGKWALPRLPFWAVHLALPLTLLAFFSLVPAGLEQRYLLPALPSVLCLAAASLTCLPRKRQPLVAAVAAVLAFIHPFGGTPSPKRFTGFAPAAALLADAPPGAKFLVVSDARGEGAFITEVALRDHSRPSRMVKRGSKILATSDWLGRDYETIFDDEEELTAFLDQTDLAAIVIDEGVPEIFRRSYHDLIRRVLASGATPFSEVLAVPAVRSAQDPGESRVLVYRRLNS